VVVVPDDDVHLPHAISTRVGHQSTAHHSLVGPEPNEAFALEKLLQFRAPQLLKAYRREEALHVADLVLRPHFDAERSPVRKSAFIPSDIARVVVRRLRGFGSTV